MKITNDAIRAILYTMTKSGLDPAEFSLYFCNPGGNEGMAFNFVKDEIGTVHQFDDLKVIIALDVNMDEVVIDLRQVDGRVGLIFTGEQDVN